MLRIKEEHDLVGTELLPVEFFGVIPVIQSIGPQQTTRDLLLCLSITSVIKSLYIAQLFHFIYISSLYYAD